MSADFHGMLPVQIRTPSGKTGVFYVHTGAVIHPTLRSLVKPSAGGQGAQVAESKNAQAVSAKKQEPKKEKAKQKPEQKTLKEDLCRRLQSQLKSATMGISLQKFFRKFDKDRSGTLNTDELRRLIRIELRITPATMSDKDVETLVAALDDDGGGQLSVDELVDFIERGTATFWSGPEEEVEQEPQISSPTQQAVGESAQTDSDFSVGDIVYCNGDLASIISTEGTREGTLYVVRIAQTGEKVACKRHHMRMAIPRTLANQQAAQGVPPEQQAWMNANAMHDASYMHIGQLDPSLQPFTNAAESQGYPPQPEVHVPNHALVAATEALDQAEVEILRAGRVGQANRHDPPSNSWTSPRDQYPGYSRNYALQAAAEALGIMSDSFPAGEDHQSAAVDTRDKLAEQVGIFSPHNIALTEDAMQTHYVSAPQVLEGYGTAMSSSMSIAHAPAMQYAAQLPELQLARSPSKDRTSIERTPMPTVGEDEWPSQQEGQDQTQTSTSYAEVREALCQPPSSFTSVDKGISQDPSGLIGVDNVGSTEALDDDLELSAMRKEHQDDIIRVSSKSEVEPQSSQSAALLPDDNARQGGAAKEVSSSDIGMLKPSRPDLPKNPIAPPALGKPKGSSSLKSAALSRDNLLESILDEPLPISVPSAAERTSKGSLKASFLPGVGSPHSRSRGPHGSHKRSLRQTGGGIMSKPETSRLPNLGSKAQAAGGPRGPLGTHRAQAASHSKFRQSWRGQASGFF